MSYEKQTWVTGDTITAEKLNHMEDGIAAGGGLSAFVVNFTLGAYDSEEDAFSATADKTFAEIAEASATMPIVADLADSTGDPIIHRLLFITSDSYFDGDANITFYIFTNVSTTYHTLYTSDGGTSWWYKENMIS